VSALSILKHTYTPLAHPARVGEVLLVARNAAGVVVGEDVAVASQALIAGHADKMLGMEVFSQGLQKTNKWDVQLWAFRSLF
jgi:hypothetical protein